MATQKFCLIKDIDGTPTKFIVKKSLPRLLPQGYTLVDGLITDGVAYVDTGIVPDTTSKWDFYGTFKVTQSGDQVILGSRENSGNTRFFPFATAVSGVQKANYAYSAYAYGNDLPLNTKSYIYTHLEAGTQSSQVEGSERPDTRGLDFPAGTTLTKSLYLFRNNYSSPNECKAGLTCWYIKAVKDGVTVGLFVSCMRNSDGEYGIYDLVTNTFHGNANTSGTLTGGKDIIQVEYITSSGTQYLNLNHTATKNTKFSVDYQFTALPSTTSGGAIIGAYANSYQGYSLLSSTSNNVQYRGYTDTISSPTALEGKGDLNRHNAVLEYKKLTFDESEYTTTYTDYSGSALTNTMIFARYNAGNLDLFATMKLYSAGVEENGTVIRDLVPIRIGTTGYLLDKANWRVYENAGTGAFTYGDDKQYEFTMLLAKEI